VSRYRKGVKFELERFTKTNETQCFARKVLRERARKCYALRREGAMSAEDEVASNSDTPIGAGASGTADGVSATCAPATSSSNLLSSSGCIPTRTSEIAIPPAARLIPTPFVQVTPAAAVPVDGVPLVQATSTAAAVATTVTPMQPNRLLIVGTYGAVILVFCCIVGAGTLCFKVISSSLHGSQDELLIRLLLSCIACFIAWASRASDLVCS
jgi:hypothetical protein